MLGQWVGGSGDVLLSGDAPFHLCIAHVWLTREAGDGAGPARWSMSTWQWLLGILVSTLPPSPVDTPLSPSERAEHQANDPIGLSNLGMGTRVGDSSEQPSTGYSRPGRGHTQRRSLVRSPCSFLKVLPRHVPPFGTQFFSPAFLCLVSVCSPAALGEPTGEDLGLSLSILAAGALVLGPAGDAEEEEGRSAEKEKIVRGGCC